VLAWRAWRSVHEKGMFKSLSALMTGVCRF
jgi:hypothetical protein